MLKHRIGFAITLLLYVIFMTIFVTACSIYVISKSQIGKIDDETMSEGDIVELKSKKK